MDIRQHLMGAARGECDVKTGPAQVAVLLKGRKTQGAWLIIFYLRSYNVDKANCVKSQVCEKLCACQHMQNSTST